MRAKFVNENKLFEKSIKNIEINDIVNNKSLSHYLKDNFKNELFQAEYAKDNYINLDELGDPDEWANSEEGKNYISYSINYLAEETIDKFKYEIIGDKTEIPIWRAMTVNKDWINHLLKEGNRLGHFWSWVFEGAETHWGYDREKDTMIIESSIKENQIDWVNTIRLNMEPGNPENEIRLFKNTPLKIKKIWIDDEEVRIPEILKTKIFKA